MVVDGAHDAASALTRSLGFSMLVKRAVCAPEMVRVAIAEHGPAAPALAGTATSPAVATTAPSSTLWTRMLTLPPQLLPANPAVATPPRRSRRHRVRTPRPESAPDDELRGNVPIARRGHPASRHRVPTRPPGRGRRPPRGGSGVRPAGRVARPARRAGRPPAPRDRRAAPGRRPPRRAPGRRRPAAP